MKQEIDPDVLQRWTERIVERVRMNDHQSPLQVAAKMLVELDDLWSHRLDLMLDAFEEREKLK